MVTRESLYCVIKFWIIPPFYFSKWRGSKLKMGQLQKAFCFYHACIQLTPMFLCLEFFIEAVAFSNGPELLLLSFIFFLYAFTACWCVAWRRFLSTSCLMLLLGRERICIADILEYV